jgi:hypothetical protein
MAFYSSQGGFQWQDQVDLPLTYTLSNDLLEHTRWIDPDRPQELMPEESLSVNQDPVVRRLVAEQEKWKRRFQGTATQQPGYRIIGRAIFNTRQRLRAALLKYVQER